MDERWDTLNPIRVEIRTVEGRHLISGYSWRLPLMADTMSLPILDEDEDGSYRVVECEVVHRHWNVPATPADSPSVVLTVETGGES